MHGSLNLLTKPERGADAAVHGLAMLPAVRLDSYNSMAKDKDGFIGDRANKKVYQELVENWRAIFTKADADPFPRSPKGAVISKSTLDELLLGGDFKQKGVLLSAIDDFGKALAGVVREYLKQKAWRNTDRIVIGGGFQDCAVGQFAVGRAQALLYSGGEPASLAVIKNHPDEAGLIGSAYLVEPEELKGYDALLAVDIGGTNARVGIVGYKLGSEGDVCGASVVKKLVWRHSDHDVSRNEMVAHISDMLLSLRKQARKLGLKLTPRIGVGVPGVIEESGSIGSGTQNLPGDWDADDFHLAQAIQDLVPKISGRRTRVVLHNDAVIQGLSEVPAMSDCERWGVLTIGTGLGNAHFTNRSALDK